MTPAQYQRASDLFGKLIEMDPPSRSAALAEACGDDAELRSAVESMLREDDANSDTFDASSGIGHRLLAGDAKLPQQIGAFRIIGLIGEGGMGVVYEAEQEQPRRRVALKVMRSAGWTPQSRRGLVDRFRRETEVLARLEHPGIARIYEAGVTTLGNDTVPFFVMELVRGPRLTEFARSRQLDLTGRLELLARVCDAIQFAHEKGVIHRDLKPANIIVSESDAVPKVLDFGVARVIDADIAATVATATTQIIGTIAYMSPEQVAGNNTDVDTRSDVYALGVILYELLAHRLPHDFTGLSLPAAARVIQEKDPPRLSDAMPTGEAGGRALRGELETIVRKAMHKDRAQRYASAVQFADDLRRFLRNEPILARPATATYHFRKFTRRNPWLVASATAALVALVGGIIGTTLQARAAKHAGQRAEHEAHAAIAARDRAEHEADIANSVAKHFHDVMSMATPNTGAGHDLTLAEAIDRMMKIVDRGFEGPPEAEAIIRNAVGIVFRTRGEFDRAQREFERALKLRRDIHPPSDADVAEVLHNLALLKRMTRHPEESIPLYAEALALQRKSLEPDDRRILQTLFNLAKATVDAHHYDEGRRLIRESLALHEKVLPDRKELTGLHFMMLANAERFLKDFDSANRDAKQAVEIMRDALPQTHPMLTSALLEQANVLLAAGDAAAAEPLAREAYETNRKIYASLPDHPNISDTRNVLIAVLEKLGRTDESARLNSPASVPTAPESSRKD